MVPVFGVVVVISCLGPSVGGDSLPGLFFVIVVVACCP